MIDRDASIILWESNLRACLAQTIDFAGQVAEKGDHVAVDEETIWV
jgi:hypothetical protein